IKKTKWYKCEPHIYLWPIDIFSKNISLLLNLSKSTICKILLKPSNALKEKYYKCLPRICGKDVIVEIDEFKFVKRKYIRNHKVDSASVFGFVKDHLKKILLFHVERRNKRYFNKSFN
ncbi:hypothetical protein H311_03808, partial [Anncaliia algerae PRA109]